MNTDPDHDLFDLHSPPAGEHADADAPLVEVEVPEPQHPDETVIMAQRIHYIAVGVPARGLGPASGNWAAGEWAGARNLREVPAA